MPGLTCFDSFSFSTTTMRFFGGSCCAGCSAAAASSLPLLSPLPPLPFFSALAALPFPLPSFLPVFPPFLRLPPELLLSLSDSLLEDEDVLASPADRTTAGGRPRLSRILAASAASCSRMRAILPPRPPHLQQEQQGGNGWRCWVCEQPLSMVVLGVAP